VKIKEKREKKKEEEEKVVDAKLKVCLLTYHLNDVAISYALTLTMHV
jgi:hypothetical protein